VVSSSVNRDEAYIYGAPGSFNQIVEGSIPKGRTDFAVKASMPDPAKIAASEFVKVLRNNKIDFVGKILINNTLPITDFVLVAEKVSPPLSDLIVPLNKESVNLFAEHLLREIGRARKGSSSIDSSLVAIIDFWKEKKVYLKGFYPTDGSGLSRSNGFCARTLAEIIRTMHLSNNSEVFFNSLPIAAKDGTLQFSFKGTKLENNLRAKTGSMTRVRSLAGIFTNQAGKKVIFAVMTNNFEGNQSAAGKVMENLLNELYLLEVDAGVKDKQLEKVSR
jgi:D-alanyl-D-alanine carboxypeptidase/D-alanyl-D-alanine-endopeptidase (penicillin-binding protein 4)